MTATQAGTTRSPQRHKRSRGVTIPLIRRMAALHGAGLSCPAIKAVVELDHAGVFVTTDMVRYYVQRYGGVGPGRGRAHGVVRESANLVPGAVHLLARFGEGTGG